MTTGIYIPQPVKEFADQAREYIEREVAANDRLKWLIALGVFVLYLSGILFVSEQADTARRDLALSQIRLSQITAQAKETRWPQRAAEVEALIKELNQKYWNGDTTGLAEAGFERWIRQTFGKYGVDVRQVQLTRSPIMEDDLSDDLTTLSSVQRIRAKVVSPLEEEGLIRFLSDASRHQSRIIVEQLIVRAGRNARLEMDLATFYKSSESQQ